ncbi:MAG: response regulator [Alphaproteobacteria bacterium]
MAYNFASVKVLVVDDNAPMVKLAKSLLMVFGVKEIMTARNGEEGFRICCEKEPDIVIADWMMEGVDGITMARRIRNNPKSLNPYVPIILMTGFSEQRRVEDARDAGVTEFLVKPFNARDLYRRIAQIVEKPRQFVRTESFFGPDRRRKANPHYNGVERRKARTSQREEEKVHALRKFSEVLRQADPDDVANQGKSS